uniref:LIM zinc-binding domain-containing protein n=1 Tax=Timema monikensis TaxID=170555 RepID=A0A7R9E433_9NEOP|nr:unnamed protein product [Timema monikensis]
MEQGWEMVSGGCLVYWVRGCLCGVGSSSEESCLRMSAKSQFIWDQGIVLEGSCLWSGGWLENARVPSEPEEQRSRPRKGHKDISHSISINSDSMPKSAHIIQHHGKTSERLSKLSGLEGVTADVDLAKAVEEAHLECQECAQPVHSGEVAVFAERAGENAMWHPQCFTCHTCKELLVDLVYFFYKSNVYCGRHFADLLNIPRCFACDELIFVKEYTMAEEHAFHVKHFCCFECDVPLGGKKYVVKHDQPICLSCYAKKYGKKCYTCGKLIAAEDQRVSFNDFHWHVTDSCFCCHQCSKPLAGRKFVVKKEQPLCSSECVMEFLRLNN